MNILKILIHVFKVLLHKSIEVNGIGSLETLNLSQRLDKLISSVQMSNYNRYRIRYS
ncbi:Spo0E family sporulation regulatory protein-aspartic acid phosphatase [Clostridium sp. D53t1_180928_C8]|uniref:Spo0E family sporulation regulatory protein-aspartic acid phosphatase n=1 Tax=Clostridium sp. D53t1_180928_C8 TaxID=2787101 RepID=UPI0018AA918A|nr:Spo0E family sporulation regulatory protein-aspartic acid phosphatase [Clostridium sp. D53t1_180928_C8]